MHLYHVSMMAHASGVSTYKDAFVKRTEPLEFGDDFAGFRDYLHKEFFPNHENGPVLLSLTDHGARNDAPDSETSP